MYLDYDKNFLSLIKNDKNIKLMDNDGDVNLYCYKRCNELSPNYIKKCRGLIEFKNNIKLVGYGYTYELIIGEEKITEKKNKIKNDENKEINPKINSNVNVEGGNNIISIVEKNNNGEFEIINNITNKERVNSEIKPEINNNITQNNMKDICNIIGEDNKMIEFKKTKSIKDVNNHLENLINLDFIYNKFSSLKFFDAYEVTLLRLFYINDKWYLSTHKKLNAFKSKWGSKDSFGKLFSKGIYNIYVEENKLSSDIIDNNEIPKDFFNIGNNFNEDNKEDKNIKNCLIDFLSYLDKDNSYIFLVRNTIDNRLVCKGTEKVEVYYSGTFDKNLKLNFNSDITNGYLNNLKKCNELKFKDIKELKDYVNKLDWRESPGIHCFYGDTTIKIVSSKYKEYQNIRGNESNILYRYINLRKNIDKIKKLIELYPNYNLKFHIIENKIKTLASKIYNFYVERYIKKRYVTRPREEYLVMKDAHEWHKKDRDINKNNVNNILNIINNQPSINIFRMINKLEEWGTEI